MNHTDFSFSTFLGLRFVQFVYQNMRVPKPCTKKMIHIPIHTKKHLNMYQKESICTKIFGTHGACTKIFWYTQRCVPKYIIFSFSSAYKLVYQFFSTYCIVYQKLGILFGTRCNMYHIFGTRGHTYQKYPCIKIFWYISSIFLVHHQFVPKMLVHIVVHISVLGTRRFGDH